MKSTILIVKKSVYADKNFLKIDIKNFKLFNVEKPSVEIFNEFS